MAVSTCKHEYKLKRVRNLNGRGMYANKSIRMAKYECRCREWMIRMFWDENNEIPKTWKWKIYNSMDDRRALVKEDLTTALNPATIWN